MKDKELRSLLVDCGLLNPTQYERGKHCLIISKVASQYSVDIVTKENEILRKSINAILYYLNVGLKEVKIPPKDGQHYYKLIKKGKKK